MSGVVYVFLLKFLLSITKPSKDVIQKHEKKKTKKTTPYTSFVFSCYVMYVACRCAKLKKQLIAPEETWHSLAYF